MRDFSRGRKMGGELTRISVKGTVDGYLVRNGDEAPVRIHRTRVGLRCECGYPHCAHLDSLLMCGFIEEPDERAKAA